MRNAVPQQCFLMATLMESKLLGLPVVKAQLLCVWQTSEPGWSVFAWIQLEDQSPH